jgi:hypothetical protein
MQSIIKDEYGRLVQVVRPKSWQASSVKLSRERTDRIARARQQRKTWRTTTQWMNELNRHGITELEATDIPWAAVQRWLDELGPHESFAARRLVQYVLEVLADDKAPQRERLEARNELYKRLIAAGIMD